MKSLSKITVAIAAIAGTYVGLLGSQAYALDTAAAVTAIGTAGDDGAVAGLAVIAAVGVFIAVPVILRMMKKI